MTVISNHKDNFNKMHIPPRANGWGDDYDDSDFDDEVNDGLNQVHILPRENDWGDDYDDSDLQNFILMRKLMTVWTRCTSCQERTHNPMSRPSIWQAQQRFLLTDDDDGDGEDDDHDGEDDDHDCEDNDGDGEDNDAEMSNCCLGSIQFALDSMWSHLAGRSSCETPPSRNKSGQMGPTIIDTEVLQCDLYLYQSGN